MEASAFEIGLWDPRRDDLQALTELLHRAYRELAERGLRYLATHQSADVTARRIARGLCFVARGGGGLAGTILFEGAAQTAGCSWYDRPEVASFHQFGVDPAWRHRGVGAALLAEAEAAARRSGAGELALDTAETADHLIAYYEARGYRRVGAADWRPETNYASVILSKPL